jgi:hypothetical protein
MRKRQRKACYYCGAPASSLEHAPAKQFFKGFPCDRITVPACDEHNNHKSGNDQAIVSAFLLSLHNGSERYSLDEDVLKAIENAKPSFVRAKRKITSTALLSDPPSNLVDLPNLAHLSPAANIRSWVRQLTAALVYDANETYDPNIKWDEAVAWSPHWIGSDVPSPIESKQVVSILTQHHDTRTWIEGLPLLRSY